MAEVVTFVGYRPPPRYDAIPWTEARIEEAATEAGTYTQLGVTTLTPVDADPALPVARSFTIENGTALDYWYRIIFADSTGDTSVPTTPVQNVTGGTVPTVSQYVETAELARVLQLHRRAERGPDGRDATGDRGGVRLDRQLPGPGGSVLSAVPGPGGVGLPGHRERHVEAGAVTVRGRRPRRRGRCRVPDPERVPPPRPEAVADEAGVGRWLACSRSSKQWPKHSTRSRPPSLSCR